ncbi:hypothetical protein [Mucilaginibacter flavidus]|uniref:hypothetical protein n=1 Tax=Mucilaginibacter flavidus TaxID=2949309 RepID=UPI0020933A1B|nr:hypothetical protein [Mucilaginibacter flavidus]MCO5949474.1 hypothetical protein [Mucilaginibacter flavidus]
MKNLFSLFVFFSFCSQVFSQTVVITDDATYTTGNTSSVLDVKSVLKGFLAPRMTQAQRTAVTTPPDGLLVYQTDATKGFYYYNGTTAAWVLLAASAGTNWSLAGNGATNPNTSFLGTTDNVSFKVRTNNTQRFLVDSAGNVAVGTAPVFTAGTPREKFLVDAGSSSNPNTSFNVISGKGYIDNYLQLNIQNKAATASASSDVVASNDAATELVNYVDLGINSSGYTGTGVIGGASNGYLYSTGNDFAIGNGTAGKNLTFFTGGVGANERMRIDGSGNVGVATTTPTAKLDVGGTYKLGSAGTVLTNMIKTSFNINDNSTFAYGSPTQVESVTVTGATVNATVIVNPRTALPQGISIAWSRVTATNTINVGFVNADATLRAIGNITFDVTVIQ